MNEVRIAMLDGIKAGEANGRARDESTREYVKRILAPHTLDPQTSRCTVCGNTIEAILDNLAPMCVWSPKK